MKIYQHLKSLTLFLLLMALNIAALCQGQTDKANGFKALPIKSYMKQVDGILFHLSKGLMKMEILTPMMIHVVYTPTQNFTTYPKLAVVKKNWKRVSWHIQANIDFLNIITDSLKVSVNKETGAISYYDSRNKPILSEPQSGSKKVVPATVQGEKTYHVTQRFNFRPDEGLYGLGQYQNRLMDYAGHDVLMLQSDINAVVPFLVSTKGYGILWNNTSQSWFRDIYQGAFWSEVADQIDYYFVYGLTIHKVISGYRSLTGKAPMFGKWVFGFIQSKEHYKTEKELLGVVAEYRKRQIPLDVIVQDWHYWGDEGWNTLTFNKERYPEPAKMIDSIHDQYHAHLLLSVWPKFGDKTAIYKAMKSKGYLYPEGDGQGNFTYDAFNPNARKIYWQWINKGLFSKGVDAWWLDATEPDIRGLGTSRRSTERNILLNKHNYLGTEARYILPYSLMTTQGIYKHQRATTSKKRVFILTRSSFAGQQRNAAATWSGDTKGRWDVFKKQVSAGLNFCLAGIPYWTTDIGGFYVNGALYPGGTTKNEAYRDLYVRWFEYGAFCPLFRVHGMSIPRAIWHFGEPGSWSYDALVKTDKLRYRLLPYIYSQAWQVTHNNSTLMRGLVYDFQNDLKVRHIWDEFMFGPSFLVCPVTDPKVSSRNVYLPDDSTGWIDFWTGAPFKGGQSIDVPTPMDHIPLFIREGSIIPMGPVLQYASQKPENPLELRIYRGKNGQFTLYEDEDDNYDYEKGIYSTIKFVWNNEREKLIIGKRKGSFPGMLEKRTFRIVLVGKGHGIGLPVSNNPDKTVTYNGDKMVVTFK